MRICLVSVEYAVCRVKLVRAYAQTIYIPIAQNATELNKPCYDNYVMFQQPYWTISYETIGWCVCSDLRCIHWLLMTSCLDLVRLSRTDHHVISSPNNMTQYRNIHELVIWFGMFIGQYFVGVEMV